MPNNLKIFACSNSEALTRDIVLAARDSLNLPCVFDTMNKQVFSDGEFIVSFEDSVRGDDLFIVQSTSPNADNLMELLLSIDAAKRASARRITAVIPYFGWARQDRKDKPRVPIGAKLVANLIKTAGANRVITIDLHADQIQGFFDIPVDHLSARAAFIPYFQEKQIEDLAIASPDIGGSKRATFFANNFNAPLVICHKTRVRANEVASMTAIGDVSGKNVLIVDDMIDTAGTLCKAAEVLISQGAKSVSACATHAILSGPARERIANSVLKNVYVTDTLNVSNSDKIKVVSVAPVLAKIIACVHNEEPTSDKFIY